ncbi:hypothetical protein EOL96_00935 [Candidatus Saccharibacteria bacterium]|nr:hypothetical protein [Candidatus Saccharibacteria bacterium]
MKRSITALSIILLGIVIFLANSNVYNMQAVFAEWWPVTLIWAAGLIYINNHRRYGWPLVLGIIGVLILLNNLTITNVDIGNLLLPGVIITIGASMLMRRSDNTQESRDDSEDITAILAGATNKNASSNFKGAKATAVMGGIEMDISHAEIKNNAVLQVFVLMGGLDVRVPENVVVKNRSTVILGGFEDKTRPSAVTKKAPILYIDGSVTMGGVEVKR